MKIKDLIFTIVFISVITVTGIYVLVLKDKQEVSNLEQRKLSQIESLTINNWLEETYQKSIESTLTDYFLFREDLLRTNINLDMSLNSIIDICFVLMQSQDKNKQITIKKINDEISLIKDYGYLVRSPYVYDKGTEINIINNISKINNLSEEHNNIKFYVYLPTMPHETNIIDQEYCGEKYLKLFKKLKVSCSKLEITNIHEISNMFFRTDHHWNNKGSYKGYMDIIELLFDGKKNPNTPVDEKCFEDFTFYGSHSRKTAYAVKMKGDKICKYIFKLPDYKLYINGQLTDENGNYSKYLKGEIYREQGFDHYNSLYQRRRGEIMFDTNRNHLENILIISDSMSNPIRDVIASHFNKSIFINLDMYYSEIGEFNIDDYISEYKIKKVLIMDVLANYFPGGEMDKLKVVP